MTKLLHAKNAVFIKPILTFKHYSIINDMDL
jgi:hypothetical protein